MKTKNTWMAAIAVALPAAAWAQSGVTLYGVADAALSYQTHANAAGNSLFGLQQGGEGFLSGSRFGLKGNEDLGGGMSAGFVLENGFIETTGKLDQQGQLFGRQAYVRLTSKDLGEVSLGRQYTTANTLLYYVDPLGIGAAPSNSWMVFLTGQRYDNSVVYSKDWGPVSLIAQYAFGETAGKPSATSSAAVGLKYASGPIVAVGDFQQTRDSASRAARIYLAGLKGSYGSVAVFANYIHSDRDANFDSSKGGTDTASITSMTTAATATNFAAYNSVFGSKRTDDFFTLGATYALTSNVSLTGSVMYDRTRATAFSGSRTTVYAVADYAFSKRTDVYLAAAYDSVRGDWSGVFANSTTNWTGGSGKPLNGSNNQTTVMAGLRHKF
ncbi:porin [Ralstonia chuxiongensis]|uniref:porin n=1 Tax=Ralstonia chuxiongensis TaxID=2957504 RepID=UPI0028F5F770|nr:porin [Ralstonia chuxiongensis]CAJ0771567.1 hypothetical protein R8510_01744 [Ralstonia chuxiongensis]